MKLKTILVVLISFCAFFVSAQKVLYSPFIGNESQTRFEVIGKTGDYYWVQKSKNKFRYKKPTEPWVNDKDLKFEIYDERVNLVKTIPSFISENITKEYFVTADEWFDQLILQPVDHKTLVLLNRYTPDGNLIRNADTLCEFPATMKCGDFLLVRSQNKNKILLLGFEPVAESSPKLHSLLFDKDWKLIYQTVYTNRNISKPFVQYDLIDYPLEDFNSNPVKLGNNGDWLMAVSSRVNHNYLLFHFNGTNEEFVYKEIKLSTAVSVEEIVLSLDNVKQESFAGILSRIRNPAIKDVRMVHYSLTERRIDFDTSFRFNTVAANKVRNENIYEEYLLAIPGKGCMLLKEYGRPFSSKYSEEQQSPEANSIANNVIPAAVNKNEYTRYGNLFGGRNKFDRGDLSLYYFPATANDSCWSGIINKEQITELNSSYLSYVFLPKEEKLFFLYNSFFRSRDQYGSTTVLDEKGNPLDEGVAYWKINNTLVFQKARQISENELAIPYERNLRKGFAIIRL
jgi:hypothetical protein